MSRDKKARGGEMGEIIRSKILLNPRYRLEMERALKERKISPEIIDLIWQKKFIRQALLDILEGRGWVDFWHAIGVAEIILFLTKVLHFLPFETEILRSAALMHDVGKIFVDKKEILHETSDFSLNERKEMAKHIWWSFDYLLAAKACIEAEIALRHHPFGVHCFASDHGAYQENLQWDSWARILSIADIFETMDKKKDAQANRPHIQAKPWREILAGRADDLRPFSSPREQEIIRLLIWRMMQRFNTRGNQVDFSGDVFPPNSPVFVIFQSNHTG